MAEWKYISRNLWRSYSLVWWFTEKKFWPSDDRLCCILQRKKKWREWNDLEKKVLVSDFEFKNQWQFCVAKIFSVCLCVCKREKERHWGMKDKMKEGDVQSKKSYFTDYLSAFPPPNKTQRKIKCSALLRSNPINKKKKNLVILYFTGKIIRLDIF